MSAQSRPAAAIPTDARAAPTARSGGDPPETDTSRHVRTQLLWRISHDIASPTGVALTVLEEIAASTEQQGRARPELFAMARRSLKRLMRLSEHLSLVAEIEAESLQHDRCVVDLRAIVEHALDSSLAVDGRKDVVATCDLPAQSLRVSGDARLLTVAVREIIGNALRLATSRVAVSAATRGDAACVRVDDDGPGFSEEASALFGRRFVDRNARGLGLSLSIAADIVNAHGGAVETEPSALQPGRKGSLGAAVLVTLPLHPLRAPDDR